MVLLKRALPIFLLAISPASAQVINGESTYGDSDLHQPPADNVPPASSARREERPPQSAPPERR